MHSREDVVKLLLTKKGVDSFSTGGVSLRTHFPLVLLPLFLDRDVNSSFNLVIKLPANFHADSGPCAEELRLFQTGLLIAFRYHSPTHHLGAHKNRVTFPLPQISPGLEIHLPTTSSSAWKCRWVLTCNSRNWFLFYTRLYIFICKYFYLFSRQL